MLTMPNEMAFPVPGSDSNYMQPGLTKREHFAAIALQGLLATPEDAEKDARIIREHGFNSLARLYAKSAVDYADALIAALNE